MGVREGVAAYAKKENPGVFILGCPCHRLNLAAEKGACTLPFIPADILVSIYYYLEKSSKRHKELKEVQKLCGTENHKILKHVCTRWLSLEKALNRMLEQWPALLEYFKQEVGQGSQKKRKNETGSSQSKKQKSMSSTSEARVGKTAGDHTSKSSHLHHQPSLLRQLHRRLKPFLPHFLMISINFTVCF